MDTLTFSYVIYTSAAIGLTGILARTLYRSGAVFLDEVFDDKPNLAEAVNSLLVTGFYMLNLGYAFMIFRTDAASTPVEAFENLIEKLGLLLLSLGVIHFINMWVFWRLRRNALTDGDVPANYSALVPPPPEPHAFTAAAEF